MQKKNNKQNKGYTIIETMIAVSLFVVVILSGMSALLNANLLHNKSSNMRSIMDNLSFILEDMSRNIRTGYNYHCFVSGDTIPVTTSAIVSTPKSCASGWAVAFESQNGSTSNNDDQWLYYISNGKIFKSTIGPYAAASFVQLTPDEVAINAISQFSVLGAEIPSANKQQPFVGIKLVGTITFKNVVTPFSLQTSVSQRLIDTGVTVALPSDTIWVEDALPTGAIPATSGGDSWNWVASTPAPFSGSLANKSNIFAGEHQHYFTGATSTLAVTTGNTMVAYVYLDPTNPPTEIMLQWNVGGNGAWEHRAYWGANSLAWGTNGTNSRRYMGVLPAVGQWVRLEVPASQVGLEGETLNGMAFSLFGGQATWDHAGKNP